MVFQKTMEQVIEKDYKEIEWKSISVDDTNKKELYKILRDLEKYHNKRFRINVALKHIITIYNKILNKEKFYNII
ncbi:hypothetical protein LCGC14_1123310 [marine sediment metagenome]|uniref:Uncharacterized protein n=1 Tax=marine sediment metagenome TaxID=412755 RepID=A0A0F9M838_9ZZZZ